jgi:hypothetical protein
MITVVIPTITGREAWLTQCLSAYRDTSPSDTQYIIELNQPTCGHGWVAGAKLAKGDYVQFSADDLEPVQDWWQEPLEMLEQRVVPACNVLTPQFTPATCDSPLGNLGHWPNVQVPLLTKKMLQEDPKWLLPIHYGSDDWISYWAVKNNYPVVRCPSYRMLHHVAGVGRDYTRRHGDVEKLALAMQEAGYLPPVYEKLELRLRTSETGLDNVRIRDLARVDREQLREQRA